MRFFITGTDTEIGKTYSACALLSAFSGAGYSTLGLKPVAAGCDSHGGQRTNEDARALRTASSVKVAYGVTNPVALEAAIAPHIAAREEGVTLSVASLNQGCQAGLSAEADVVLIEGAGGWLVPLNDEETLADFAVSLNVPVILVVGLRLGCLNHALLTAQAIQQQGLTLAGWIGNQPQPQAMSRQAENIATLTQRMPAPCLGILPFAADADSAPQHLTLQPLLG